MNATEGIRIQKGDGEGDYQDVIFLDAEGDAVFKGTVEASNFIGGSIDIGNGTFTVDSSGNLVATSAEIQGDITATSGEFSGNIDVTGTLTVTDGKITTSDTGRRIEMNDNELQAFDSNENIRVGLEEFVEQDYYEMRFRNEINTLLGTLSATSSQFNIQSPGSIVIGANEIFIGAGTNKFDFQGQDVHDVTAKNNWDFSDANVTGLDFATETYVDNTVQSYAVKDATTQGIEMQIFSDRIEVKGGPVTDFQTISFD